MKVYIKALSYYLPERIVTNAELLKDFPEWSVDKVTAKVGVTSRHLAADNETAGDCLKNMEFLLLRLIFYCFAHKVRIIFCLPRLACCNIG